MPAIFSSSFLVSLTFEAAQKALSLFDYPQTTAAGGCLLWSISKLFFFREIARRFSPSLSVRWPPVNQGAKRGLGENQFRALFLLPATSHIILKKQSRTWHAADALLLFFSVYGKRNSPKCSKHLGECNENCGNSFAVQKGKIYFLRKYGEFRTFWAWITCKIRSSWLASRRL